MKRVFTFLIILIPFFLAAQTSKIEKYHKAKYFEPAQELNTEQFIAEYFDDLGLENPSDLKKGRRFESKNGWVRNRYKQEYRGLEVLASSFILHEQNGIVKRSTGSLLPDINIDINPTQTLSAIQATLRNHILISEEVSSTDLFKLNEEMVLGEPRLCIMDRAFPDFSGKYKLVYELTVEKQIPEFESKIYYLDANTSEILYELNNIHGVSVQGQANTNYYGSQAITVDSISPNLFRLYDEGRDIVTVNFNERDFSSGYTYAIFEDDNNWWNNYNEDRDEVATDAHYCAAAYYDFMNDNFGWKGLDGLGNENSTMLTVVHWNGTFYLNAFYSPSRGYVAIGNGLCIDYDPLTTLDVIGHEYAHAFTNYTSGLIYRGESGALNESISDILGKAIESKYDPDNFNWLIGDRFAVDNGEAFRNMADPNDKEDPKYYEGEFWIDPTGFYDNGGVHFNSGVYNFWYYLLVEGGSGINEGGNSYSVEPIGWEDATDIVYGAQVGYFEPSTGYKDAYTHTLQYTEDVFGQGSSQYLAVEEAWRAVGITSNEVEDVISVGGTIQVDGIATTICTNECIDVTLDIVNLGGTPIDAQTSIELRYILDNDILANETLVLTQDLNVGDTLPFTFGRQICWFDINGSQDYLEIEISSDGGNEYTQFDYDFINLNSGAPFDVEFTRFELTSNVCDSDFYFLQYRFENEGCETIPEGTQYQLIINVNGNEQIETRTLNADSRPSVGQIVLTSFDFDVPLDNKNDYTVELVFSDDPNLSNNTLSGVFNTYEVMEEGNIEGYSNYNTNGSQWVFTDEAFYSFTQSMFHASSERLIVGSDEQFFEFNEPQKCITAEDFMLSASFINKTRLNICYDTKNMQDPVLRFEYIPYYSGEVPGLIPEFTSLHEISFPDYNEQLPIQYGFSEGDQRTLTYDIPIGNEELTITVLCLFGNEFEASNGNLSNGDYQLFDNIRIEERGTVATEDELLQADISVFPNPANGQINFVDAKDREFNLKVFGIDGKQVYSQKASKGNFTWDIEQSLNGLFIYEMQFQDGRTANGKFILENR